ncbi:MAG TPA: prepilin-type N-terminal cleavage/methylation domain-containing protein [Burkholderiales bacterium]|nr:prepilin-type N-terminal cleavage/methylation domain-containing protein [Burkholderiales bacterium]
MRGPTHHTERFGQRGFTLVELVVVIVVLGVLAAVAMPKLFDQCSGAYKSVVAQTDGAFTSAINQAYAGCVLANYPGKDNLSTFGDGKVDFNTYCYPASTNGNNGNGNAARCLQIWNSVLAFSPTLSTPAKWTTDYRAQGKRQRLHLHLPGRPQHHAPLHLHLGKRRGGAQKSLRRRRVQGLGRGF